MVQRYQLNRLIECLINANYLHYSCKIRLTYCKYPVFLSPLHRDTVSKDLIGNPVRIRNNTRCCISHTGIPGDSATATAARREGAESGKSQKTGRYAIKAHPGWRNPLLPLAPPQQSRDYGCNLIEKQAHKSVMSSEVETSIKRRSLHAPSA